MEPYVTALLPDTGTYLKVIRFPERTNSDAHVVLYLRPRGRFLFLGFWPGYERSSVAGDWSIVERKVVLIGDGSVAGDSLMVRGTSEFRRSFRIAEEHSTPVLVSDADLKGWSLLSWRGPFSYVGKDYVVDPGLGWLPKVIGEVDRVLDLNSF